MSTKTCRTKQSVAGSDAPAGEPKAVTLAGSGYGRSGPACNFDVGVSFDLQRPEWDIIEAY